MLTLRDYSVTVANVCLERVASDGDLDALGGDPRRWLRYRRMVRKRLEDLVRATFPRLIALLGEAAFDALLDGFFQARALSSPLIRDVPGELLGWLDESVTDGSLQFAPYALELGALEWAERVVAYAEDDRDDVSGLTMEQPARLTGAHRLLAFRHAVHRFDPEAPAIPEATKTWLAVYRDGENTVRVLETSAVAHALLEELAPGVSSLKDCITRAASRTGAVVDLPFIAALSDLLADFSARGIVRGAPLDAPATDLPRRR